MYEFVRCAPDPRFPDQCGWYMKVPSDDQELFEKVHHAMALALFRRFDCDPHIQKDPIFSEMVGLQRLGEYWGRGFDMLAARDGIVYVNSSFGFLPEPPAKVLASQRKRKFEWPSEIKGWITIQRWAGRPHWYLSTRDGRAFDPPKHNTLKAAEAHARRLVPAKRIQVNSKREGKKPLEGD
jgi:hypothetical protein